MADLTAPVTALIFNMETTSQADKMESGIWFQNMR